MTSKIPIWHVFVYEKDFVYTVIIASSTINAVPQKANQMRMTKLCKQIQPEFKISNGIFL